MRERARWWSSRFAPALVALIGLFAGHPALAADNDPVLRRFFTDTGNGPVPDQALFREMVREYGMAFAPKLLAPAETLGVNGFEIATELSITDIDEQAQHWQLGVEDESPPQTLLTTQLRVRKGLPFSFEIGGVAAYMVNSELWAFGGELKWAINEGIEAFPVDFAVRGAFNATVGSTELNLRTFGLDIILSRSFGAGGVVNIAPYMAYNPTFIFATSGVLDSTPIVPDDPARNFVFGDEQITLHRFVVGTRLVFALVNFTPEVVFAEGIQSYNFNLGLDF